LHPPKTGKISEQTNSWPLKWHNDSQLLQTIPSNAATTDLITQPLHHSREICLGVKESGFCVNVRGNSRWGYHKCIETCNPVVFRHIGITPRYDTQSNANEYITEIASFIGRAKQQQQKYCNSFQSVYETKTGQVQSKEYCNKEDLFIYNIFNSLLKSVNYGV